MPETLIDVMQSIELQGIDYAYHHFAEGEVPTPPFAVFVTDRSNNYAADNVAYARIGAYAIELYTDYKDPQSESIVETVLDEYEIFWNKEEIWIDSQNLYEVKYTFEMEDK